MNADAIRSIRDPEHPQYTLEDLGVVDEDLISVRRGRVIRVRFRPTVDHCSLVTHIALFIVYKVPERTSLFFYINPLAH